MMIRRTGVALAAVVVLATGLAACGDDSGDDSGDAGSGMTAAEVYAKFGQMSPDERDPQLLELAKKEGAIQHYSTWSFGEDQGKAFTEKYGIPVTVYSTDNETVLQKISQEHDAGRDNADVVDMGARQMTLLTQEGVFSTDWVHGRDTEPITQGIYPTRFVAFVVGWNTDMVSDADAPRSYEDLANPAWKGKISFEAADFDWFAGLRAYYTTEGGMTDDEFMSLWQKIVQNGHPVKGHTAMVTSLSSGEDWVASVVYTQNVDDSASEGAPIAWRTKAGEAVEPIVTNPSGVGIMADANNPAGAMLFADWLTSPEGQQVYADNDALPADQSVGNFPQDLQTIGIPNDELLASDDAETAYTDLIRGAGGA